jgi:hypothetical protein
VVKVYKDCRAIDGNIVALHEKREELLSFIQFVYVAKLSEPHTVRRKRVLGQEIH